MIRLLFDIRTFVSSLLLSTRFIKCFAKTPRYDIAFVCPNDAERRFGLFNRFACAGILEARFRAEGLTIADDTRGFDIVIAGDTVRDPKRLRLHPCCVSSTTAPASRTILVFAPCGGNAHTRYQIFVEGDYRIDKIRQSERLGSIDVCTRSVCRSSISLFRAAKAVAQRYSTPSWP